MFHPKIQVEMLRHQVNLLRLEANTRRRVLRILDTMIKELTAKASAGDLTKFSKARVDSLLKQATGIIESYYAKIDTMTAKTLKGVAEIQVKQAIKTLERALSVVDFSASVPSEALLGRIAGNALIMGATSEDWWARQAKDVAFRFSNAVRQGIVAGDTTEQIVARIVGRGGHVGIMDVTRANARSLVHTSIMEVSADARRETFIANDDVIVGVRQVSTLDSNTTEICMAYDGAEFDLDGEPLSGTDLPYESGVPRHWGCRSVEVPITKTFKQLGIDAPEPRGGERASSDGPVPAKWTFEDFLNSQTKEEQDEILGAGRAELWRDGKITLQQLLDLKGNPLTLDELRKKYD